MLTDTVILWCRYCGIKLIMDLIDIDNYDMQCHDCWGRANPEDAFWQVFEAEQDQWDDFDGKPWNHIPGQP